MYGGKSGPEKGLRLNPKTLAIESVEISDDFTADDAIVYDETNQGLAMLIAKMKPPMPVAMGIIYRVQRPIYENQVHAQIQEAKSRKNAGDLQRILEEGNTWTVE